MRRIALFELHDHPAFPEHLRNLVTDALQSLWRFGNSYKPILSRLNQSLWETSSDSVLDLCSGGGGPWPTLSRQLERDYGTIVQIRLTDKYPNLEAFQHAAENPASHIGSVSTSVDARRVPPTLRGFRTMFSALHHFSPAEARDVLSNAMQQDRGIAIFEVAQRSPLTLFTLLFTPFLVLWLTPRIRPFRWSRLFWTYLLPIVPFIIWWDGLISCLRAYAPQELDEMVADVIQLSSNSHCYTWQRGEERSGFLPITYLIGSPILPVPLVTPL